MMLRCKRGGKHQAYQIAITIIEAKHLLQNGNPMVVVKVGNQKRRTIVRNSTDTPYYNEYFVFNFIGEFNVFLNTKISILVYQKNCLRLKFHGGMTFEVATVWEQPDHAFYHKWAILTNSKDHAGGTRGYVKCNISVNVKGEMLRVHPENEGEDDIEGNLLIPTVNYPMLGRQRARYKFIIYRADGLPYTDVALCCGNAKPINPFIQISFAGMKGKTSWHKYMYHTRFNEEIVFTDMFPPLCFRIKISIKDKANGCPSHTLATQTLNLANLLSCCKYEYLPTFGPSFMHFYRTKNFNHECSCIFKSQSMRSIYCGRVLLSLKMEIDDSRCPITPRVDTEPSAPIIEKILWNTEKYLLVGIIYDACMIDRWRFTRKYISFEMTFGNIGSQKFPSNIENSIHEMNEIALDNRPDFQSHTVPKLSVTTDGKFNYLPLASDKPCLYIKSWWPNFEWRIINSNCLLYIVNFLGNGLAELETLIAIKSTTVFDNYNNVIKSLKDHCMQYLDILNSGKYDEDGGTTKLDRHRVIHCRECIEDIVKIIKSNGDLRNNDYIKIAMMHAYKYLQRIRKICEDPQHALPDIFIWMIAGTKRVAMARLAASEIIYSEKQLARGAKCGQRINLFMKNLDHIADNGDYGACNIEMFLWLGNIKFSSACWSSIPAGYEVQHSTSIETFPKSFNYMHSGKFQLRAHIFQARYNSGLDSMGLMDSFIRIIYRGYTATTRPIRQSLAPVWDETLVLPVMDLYGTKESIKSCPPHVIVEASDWNLCGTNKFYGRCIAKPVVKLMKDSDSVSTVSSLLMWHTFITQDNLEGSVLAAFELIETAEDTVEHASRALDDKKIYNVPNHIRPIMTSHRLEIVFWGVRDMKKIHGIRINKPRIIVECCGVHINSEIMKDAKEFANFYESHVIINLDLPQQYIYYPPLTIKSYDSRSYGRFTYVGVCIIPSSHAFFRELITEEEYNSKINSKSGIVQSQQMAHQHGDSTVILPSLTDYKDREINRGMIDTKKRSGRNFYHRMRKILSITKLLLRRNEDYYNYEDFYKNNNNEMNDWWSKYFASLDQEKNDDNKVENSLCHSQKAIATFVIYESELEMQPEFEKFQDKLSTFELSRGKLTGDSNYDQKNYSGKFKGHIAIYPWPHSTGSSCKTASGSSVENGLMTDFPPQEMVKLLVRLYVIRGINLHPCDPLSGKSDPYLIIKLGKNRINDKKNYIANQTNPIFGKSFEMKAHLPRDHTLIIQVWDRDVISRDDMIGETKIDIENRYYSDHRGGCGISSTYTTSGYNSWRDCERPMQILESLCRKNNLSMPTFSPSCVTIGKQKFPFFPESQNANETEQKECMALNVLRQWQLHPICGVALVPEHIERRPLFNVKKSGLEQGKLELWVDMFRVDELPPKPLVDITPQVPEDYELRLIIWNVEDVPLVDNQFLTEEKCSDIFIKCWITDDDCQRTDIHYNSLTGEGNFNWRFIFRFAYSKSEHLMIVRKKLSAFALDKTEQKLPCKLHLQVWDNDHFSSNDFLGSLTINLSRMPRGSANSKNCTLKVTDPNSPAVNLFKAKRMKAWWPFSRATSYGEYFQAGKVEMEFTLVPLAEAEVMPVGKGRDPPNPLPPPYRPDTSFSWFRHPWMACRFVICRYYRCRIICFCSMFLLVLLLGCAVYAFPGYLVKRLLGA